MNADKSAQIGLVAKKVGDVLHKMLIFLLMKLSSLAESPNLKISKVDLTKDHSPSWVLPVKLGASFCETIHFSYFALTTKLF